MSLNIYFLELSEALRMDSKNEFELTMVNELSVLELMRFNCNSNDIRIYSAFNIIQEVVFWVALYSEEVN